MKKPSLGRTFACVLAFLALPWYALAGQPRIRVIDWVQGRSEIPHPAVNGKNTMLQAILEARDCGTGSGDAQFRWDYNADGDFSDSGEGWTDASPNSGHYYFHYAMKDFRLPTFLGDTVIYPKIQARCRGTNPADPPSAVMPVLIRVDRICPDYPAKRDGGCGPDDNLLLTKQTVNDRAVDRAMWWMMTNFYHYNTDDHGHGVHNCKFDNYFGHGHALNVFIRRSHGAGPFRDSDPLFEHIVQCGVELNFSSWNSNGHSYRFADRRLGYGNNWMSYASTTLGEPVAGFGDPNYKAKSGDGGVRNHTLSHIAQGIANGLMDCAGGTGSGKFWWYSCGRGGGTDLSTSGWAPETLRIMTRKLGTDTSRIRGQHGWWLRAYTSYGNNHGRYRNDGGCHSRNHCRGFGTSYHVSDSSHLGYRSKLAGNALVGYGYANSESFTPNIYDGSDCWNCNTNWQLREHWIALSRLHITDPYNGTGSPWGMYYLYAATKGLRSFVPEIRYLASFQSSAGYQTNCSRGNHDACDLTTAGYDINDNYNGGCGNDGDCKSGNYCRGGRCKVVLEEGVCLAAHYKHGSYDNNISGGTGRTEHWQCSRDWALEFAQFLLPYQHSNGSFNTYGQYGFGRTDRNVMTALSAQIIQTWLETWAIARAIPQQTTPGIPVTFNHSWSHILDPGTHIKQYQWDINSLDGLWWQERNCDLPKNSESACENDGNHNFRIEYPDAARPDYGEVRKDEKIVGFVTRPVGKKGQYHSGNYFNSEQLMAMVQNEFIYTYTNAISWDDVAKIKVTLRSIDTEDRPVVDDKSVTVKLSYDNHKPVIVAHPLGANEIYSGYLGLPMYLDAKTMSYDVDQCVYDEFGNPTFGNCGNREVFPGNDEKPAGFPDKITKICFDLDRDGTFCENGEIQVDLRANPPIDLPGVTFTPEAGVVKVGELTGIPVMVCDDGRWNGRCWEQGDGAPNEFTAGVGGGMPSTCTLCAYGSATVKAVENQAPPQVPDWQPAPRKAEVTVVMDDVPQDEEHFTLTDHQGRETRFVFDEDSSKADGTRKVPEGAIKLNDAPQDGETFVLTDYNAGQGVYFVFLDDDDIADGSNGPKTIIGIDHVRVGIRTAQRLGNANARAQAVAQQIAKAINSKSVNTAGYNANNPGAVNLELYVKAEASGKDVKLTMIDNGAARGNNALRPDHSSGFPEKGGPDPDPSYYQYVNMELVSNTDGEDFAGGVVVGMQDAAGNVEKVVEKLESAVKASNLQFGKVEAVGRALKLEQSQVGFSGNTRVDMSGVTNARTQERGEAICGNFGQVCCDGVSAPKCGDGSGCLAGRCVTHGGVYGQDGADTCIVPNALMAGQPGEEDGCTCPEGLTATSIGEFDQANPPNAGGAADKFVKLFACSPGRPVTYAAVAQGDLPAVELPYSDFQGGFGKTFSSEVNGFTCNQGAGLVKTIKPLPAAQCPETGFDLDNNGEADRLQEFTIRGVRHSDPEEQCATKFTMCVDTLQSSQPDKYTFGGFFTRGGPGGGTTNPMTGAKSCPADFGERVVPMLLRHPNGGDNNMNASAGEFVVCNRLPPQRYVDLPGDYQRPTRAGGMQTFFAGHDGAYTDPILGNLNGGGAMPVWRVQPGNVMELDFSSIVDPEGVLGAEIATNGVRMIYELLPPDGLQLPGGVNPALRPHLIRPSVGFEDRVSGAVPNHNTDNFGMKPLLEPSGDGVQYFRIKVTAYDAGNKNTSRSFVVKLDNRPPRLTKFTIQPTPLPPTFPYEMEEGTGYLKTIRDYCQRQNPPIPNCVDPYAALPDPLERRGAGRHNYQVNMTAFPNAGVGLIVSYNAEEDYDEPVTAQATFISNGQSTNGGSIVDTKGTFKSVYSNLPPYQERADGSLHPDAIQTVRIQLTITDGEDTITEFKDVDIAQPPPILLEELIYNFDLHNDNNFEIEGSEDPIGWNFNMPIGSRNVLLGASMLNNDMVSSYLFDAMLPNTPPGIAAGIVSQEGREVKVSVAGGDQDWDPLTYIVDWGDGTPVSRGSGNVYTHTYPVGMYGDFTITASADDSRPYGVTSKTMVVNVQPPGTKEADITGLSWTSVTLDTGLFDGVGAFALDATGSVFAHNYSSEIRRYKASEIEAATGARQEGTLVMGDVECCGTVIAPSAGEVYVASPNGLYYAPGANGDNPGGGVAQLDASAYQDIDVTPNWDREQGGDESYILAVTKRGVLERWSRTHDLVEEQGVNVLANREVIEVQTCKGSKTLTAVNALSRATGSHSIYLSTDPEAKPDSWVKGPSKLAKGYYVSLSFDRECLLYIGGDGGYFTYNSDTGVVDPPHERDDLKFTYLFGWDLYSAYVGSGAVKRVLAWPGGKPVLAGTPRGVLGANTPWSAVSKPYWSELSLGMVGSRNVSEMALDPVSGHILTGTSAASAQPKYCRRRRRGRRRSYRYYFCGFHYNYSGGLFRTENSLLSSRTTGAGGIPFVLSQGNGMKLDQATGGLIVDNSASSATPLWQVNTLESTVSRWDPVTVPPQEVGRYRVGLPGGECAGNDSPFTAGCNNPSRLAVDNVGDVYVVSAGYDIQGTVTKIASDVSRCVDRNGNGKIDTSTDNTPRDYTMQGVQGAIGDECVLWTAAVGAPGQLLRSIVVGVGDRTNPDGYPWVGSYSDRKMYRLNPKTGVVLNSHNLDIEPFGAVLVGDTMMVSTLGTASLQPISTRGEGVVQAVVTADDALLGVCKVDNAYGVGADSMGNVWLSGWECPYALGYSVSGEYWCKVELPYRRKVGRGIAGDLEGNVWASIGGDGQSYLVNWSGGVCQAGSTERLGRGDLMQGPWGANGPTGVNVDASGKVWMSHYLSPVLMSVDTLNGNDTKAWQTNNVYSFSDATGVVRRLSIGSGSFVQDYESPCANGTKWGLFAWDASVPALGTLNFSVGTASTSSKLNEAQMIPFVDGAQPPQVVQDYFAANLNPEPYHNFLRVRVDMSMGSNRKSPMLNSFTVNWECLQ